MNREIYAEICNKLTLPNTVLEQLSSGEKVSDELIQKAKSELTSAIELLTKDKN